MSIAANGLTGERYRGHVFWDVEIFLLPFFSLTQPATARALLSGAYVLRTVMGPDEFHLPARPAHADCLPFGAPDPVARPDAR